MSEPHGGFTISHLRVPRASEPSTGRARSGGTRDRARLRRRRESPCRLPLSSASTAPRIRQRLADLGLHARRPRTGQEHIDDEGAIGRRRAHAHRRAAGHLDAEVAAGRLGEQLEEDAVAFVAFVAAAARRGFCDSSSLESQNSLNFDGSTITHASHVAAVVPFERESVRDRRLATSKAPASSPSTWSTRRRSGSGSFGMRSGHTLFANGELLDALFERVEDTDAELPAESTRPQANHESRTAGQPDGRSNERYRSGDVSSPASTTRVRLGTILALIVLVDHGAAGRSRRPAHPYVLAAAADARQPARTKSGRARSPARSIRRSRAPSRS